MKKKFATAMLLILVLTGCSAPMTKAEAQYAKDCARVVENLDAYFHAEPGLLTGAALAPKAFDNWGDTYAITNAGVYTRQSATDDMNKYKPWVMPALENLLGSKTRAYFLDVPTDMLVYTYELDSPIHLAAYEYMLRGTTFKLPESFVRLGGSMNEKFAATLDDLSPSNRFKTCFAAAEAHGIKYTTTAVKELGSEILDQPVESVYQNDIAVQLYGCSRFGAGTYWDEFKQDTVIEACAANDYVGSTDFSVVCDGKLSTTVNSAELNQCGTLNFSIFQSDLNTGDCMALGHWNDKNGQQQIGAFYICGLEEGKSYSATVRVGTPTTYTTTLGVENTVTTFTGID